jgi:hypothetical protein
MTLLECFEAIGLFVISSEKDLRIILIGFKFKFLVFSIGYQRAITNPDT